MKKAYLAFLCGIIAPLSGFASNEGVPSYYNQKAKNNAAYSKYQQYGYTKYVGKNGSKQVVSSNQYSYQIPSYYSQTDINYGAMTANGIATPAQDANTTVYAGYTRRFADFEFKTGVNSVLEWDDMLVNEINVGAKHVFDVRGFDLAVYGDYSYGKMSGGGMSMDYDLEPYDYAYPNEGIFTISMGKQSGTMHRLRFGVAAHHIWDVNGWKLTPHVGYEIFKHNLKMSDHIYPNPGVYLPLMTNYGDYVYGAIEDNNGVLEPHYYAISVNTNVSDDSGLYQICMGPEDIKIVAAGGAASDGMLYPLASLGTMDYTSSMGTVPWGVDAGECVVIGGDGEIKVDGTTHIYKTTWSGFYLGLELEKQMTLSDKLRFYAQVSLPKYSSKGIWPNRDDWQQDPSFLDEGSNGSFAYSAEMEYDMRLSDRLQLSLKADTDYFHVGKIPGKLYVAQYDTYIETENGWIIQTNPAYTEHVSESLKSATWRSFGLHVGLKYAF